MGKKKGKISSGEKKGKKKIKTGLEKRRNFKSGDKKKKKKN